MSGAFLSLLHTPSLRAHGRYYFTSLAIRTTNLITLTAFQYGPANAKFNRNPLCSFEEEIPDTASAVQRSLNLLKPPKGRYTLSVKPSNFTVWRHTWRKNWVNCAVLTGNSAGLRTVLSSCLSHRELRSSFRESHSFLSSPVFIHHSHTHKKTHRTDKPDGKPVLCQRTFSPVFRAVF
jgi:hypothetical protein